MATVMGFILTGIGLFMLVRGLLDFRIIRLSQNWPTVEGQIVQATIEVTRSSDDDGTTSTRYAPLVIYTYSLVGQQYTSDKVTFGAKWRYGSRSKAESKSNYQTGQRINVYYNPEKPEQAVLEPGAMRGAWGSLILGIVFFIFGGVILYNNLGM